MHLCGIDYGSKLAGTTVLSTFDPKTGRTQFQRSARKQDADEFLLDLLPGDAPACVFLDAPLSLPGIYRGLPNCRDYFFRQADKEVKAMSPMFLGGLTARAMQLKELLEGRGLPVYETYPAAQAKRLGLQKAGYKGESAYLPAVLKLVLESYPSIVLEISEVAAWHHLDALLALVAAIRFTKGEHTLYGETAEGVIIV
jgi:predicted nuclease with RNAse H fold